MKMYEPFQFLTTEECDDLVNYSREHSAYTGNSLSAGKVNNARIVWYEEKHARWQDWIDCFNKIEPVVDWIQSPQIATYHPGEERQWHVDTWPEFRPTARRFTLTCELQSAPGGKLEVENKNFVLTKGQAIIFRPEDKHRAVAPIEGERISLTIWAMSKNLDRFKKFQRH